MDYPFGDELKILSETGTSVGHCPHKYAKMAVAAESFDRYVEAGVTTPVLALLPVPGDAADHIRALAPSP